MPKKIKTYFLSIAAMFIAAISYSQDSASVVPDLTTGKWTICWDITFSKDHQCNKNSYATQVFLKNGTYTEDRELNSTEKNHHVVHGTWELNANALTIDENDTRTMKVPPRTENIVWLNKDSFYYQGEEGPGGPVVYTYYQRKK